MSINKYVKNLGKYEDGSKANILGRDKDVELLGKSWYNNSERLQMAMIHSIIEFNANEDFGNEEHTAFMKGLNAIPKFMMECYEEYDKINSEKESK